MARAVWDALRRKYETANGRGLPAMGGAEVAFSGVDNRTSCERCEELSFFRDADRLKGKVASGTLNQGYQLDAYDGCGAAVTGGGPNYFATCAERDCDCLLVTHSGASPFGGASQSVEAQTGGRVFVSVRIEPGRDDPFEPGSAMTEARVVVEAFGLLPHFVTGSNPFEPTPLAEDRIQFFYGTAPLCGLSFPTFVVENQVPPGAVCWEHPDWTADGSADPAIGSLETNAWLTAGAGGGVATVTLYCDGADVPYDESEYGELSVGTCDPDECLPPPYDDTGDGTGDDDGTADDPGSGDDGGSGDDPGDGDGDGDGGGDGGGGGSGDDYYEDGPCPPGEQRFRCVDVWRCVHLCGVAWGSVTYEGVACLDVCMLPVFDVWYLGVGCCPTGQPPGTAGVQAVWYHVRDPDTPCVIGTSEDCAPTPPTGGGPSGPPTLTPPACP